MLVVVAGEPTQVPRRDTGEACGLHERKLVGRVAEASNVLGIRSRVPIVDAPFEFAATYPPLTRVVDDRPEVRTAWSEPFVGRVRAGN